MINAFSRARDDSEVGVIILAGEGDKAFCSGGDQRVRGHGGYVGEDDSRLNVLAPAAADPHHPQTCDRHGFRLCHRRRACVCMSGFGDLTIAADNAIFGQTGPSRQV